MTIRVGVLTVSDRCSRGETVDLSGAAIANALQSDIFSVEARGLVADEQEAISACLVTWADQFYYDVILTTGGTGLSQRDVTPEATSAVIDREARGLSTFLLAESLKITPFAALGRGIAGTRRQTLIVNLPGSPKGAKEQLEILLPLLPHAVAVLRDSTRDHPTQ